MLAPVFTWYNMTTWINGNVKILQNYYDIVRYSIVGIIFINFAPGKGFSWISIIAGGIIVIFAHLIAFWLDGKGE